MVLSFMIEDPKDLLTKSQKEKVKGWFRTHFDESRKEYNEVLNQIHYGEKEGRYHGIKVIAQDNGFYRIVFQETNERDVLKDRLRAKLKMKAMNRSYIHGEDWKLYYQILKSPTFQMIPAERLDMTLPNPDKIRKERETYEQFQKMCRDPTLKEYFKLCLSK